MGDPSCVVPTAQSLVIAVLGPRILGHQINVALFGFVASNFASYLWSGEYGRDPLRLRVLTGAIIAVSGVSVMVDVAALIKWSIIPDRSMPVLRPTLWFETGTPFCIAICGLLLHSFLIRRTFVILHKSHKRTHARVIACCLGVFAVATFPSNILVGAILVNLKIKGLAFTIKTRVILVVWLWMSFLVNALVGGCFATALWRNTLLHGQLWDRLNLLCIQAGVYTAMFCFAAAVLATVAPAGTVWASLHIILWPALPSLYSLTLLANLSGRGPQVADESHSVSGGFALKKPGRVVRATVEVEKDAPVTSQVFPGSPRSSRKGKEVVVPLPVGECTSISGWLDTTREINAAWAANPLH